MAKNKEKQKEEEILKENLKDPIYVNYNILTKLEEIKRINYGILEILNIFYQKVIQEEQENPEEKPKKEGVFKP